jgi:hypothetical protein
LGGFARAVRGAVGAARGVVLPDGDGGRLYLATPMSASTGETVDAPARMPARNGASTPSLGGREGIWTGMSRCPEAIRRIASFLYYSSRRKGNKTIKHQPRKRDNFKAFSSGLTTQWQRRLHPAEEVGILM